MNQGLRSPVSSSGGGKSAWFGVLILYRSPLLRIRTNGTKGVACSCSSRNNRSITFNIFLRNICVGTQGLKRLLVTRPARRGIRRRSCARNCNCRGRRAARYVLAAERPHRQEWMRYWSPAGLFQRIRTSALRLADRVHKFGSAVRFG